MKITFLGTGTSQGVPVIGCKCHVCTSTDIHDNRLRSSVHILVDDLSIVIDTGPDFRQQMLREKIQKIDAVLYTHEHRDHTAGLDDIRSYNFLQREDMQLYATPRVQKAIKEAFAYIFQEHHYPGLPRVRFNTIGAEPFLIEKLLIQPVEVLHFKLPVLGFRIKDFTYVTDANFISEKEMEKLRGTKVLVLNALEQETHLSHFNLVEAVALVNKIKPEKAYFTHISHKLGRHKPVEECLPENIHLSYDGLKIIID